MFSSYDKSLTALSTMLARHGFQTRVIGPGVSVDSVDEAMDETLPKDRCEHVIALILNPPRDRNVAAPARNLPANSENLAQIPSLRPPVDAGRVLRT